MNNPLWIANNRVEEVKKVMHPLYKTPLRVDVSVFRAYPKEIKRLFELGNRVKLNGSTLTHLIKFTLRRISNGARGFAYLEIIYNVVPPFHPQILINNSWKKVLVKNTLLALSALAHELFHFFYFIKYPDKKEKGIEPIIEELSTLTFEREVLLNFEQTHPGLAKNAVLDIDAKIKNEIMLISSLH